MLLYCFYIRFTLFYFCTCYLFSLLLFSTIPIFTSKNVSTDIKYELPFNYKYAPNIIRKNIGIVANHAGKFRSIKGRYNYYFADKYNIIILNQNFEVIQSLSIAKGTALIDFGDFNGDGLDDIFFLSFSSLRVALQSKSGVFNTNYSDKIIAKGNFFLPGSISYVRFTSLGADIDFDGDYDFVLPQLDGFSFYKNNLGNHTISLQNLLRLTTYRKYLSKPKKLLVAPNIDTHSWLLDSIIDENFISVTVKLPKVHFYDWNNDSILDLSVRIGKKMYYFLSTSKTAFNKQEVVYLPIVLRNTIFDYHFFEDVDLDGDLDLLVTKTLFVKTMFRNITYIFLTTKEVPEKNIHLTYINHEGYYWPLILTNFQKNKNIFLFSKVSSGILNLTSIAVTNKVKVGFSLQALENNTFKELKTFSQFIPISLSTRVSYAIGDFNLDGISDFILPVSKRGELEVMSFNETSAEVLHLGKLSIPAKGKLITLKSDRSTDEILGFFPEEENLQKQQEVILIRFYKKK